MHEHVHVSDWQHDKKQPIQTLMMCRGEGEKVRRCDPPPHTPAFTPTLTLVGGYTARVTPVPIPNTVVKPRWADGTARETVWESTTSPAFIFESPLTAFVCRRAFMFCAEDAEARQGRRGAQPRRIDSTHMNSQIDSQETAPLCALREPLRPLRKGYPNTI